MHQVIGPGASPLKEPIEPFERVGRAGRVTHVLTQVFVRVLLALIIMTVLSGTAMTSIDGSVRRVGTATAVDCTRIGPVSTSGLGWWWQCDGVITWEDGAREQHRFNGFMLTPADITQPVAVEYRDGNGMSGAVSLRDAPYGAFGYALFVPLVALWLLGFRVPGVPPMGSVERAERRRRLRLSVWTPLVAPMGWALVVSGGLGTVEIGGAGPTLVIMVGCLSLAGGALVTIDRRRRGVREPGMWDQPNITFARFYGALFSTVAVLAVFFAWPDGGAGWQAWVYAASWPGLFGAFGARFLVVAARHKRNLPEDSASSTGESATVDASRSSSGS
ncbi:hypothetical protein GIY23_16450 [Allosaccharopolyspora coralli]|uniref:Uncharacterized protein n=1 Tax=Allosaccharopolyspora coralli TaxID=2665642 RepID=A0A5Q3Q941_9PSEU|nr:DUF6346 domain-containing protein [Allosaccharopolyspora coralli]QGK70893.1 hypothetical protein GIY23_16450 [Allosaccharopolyspora coralli]